MKPQTAEWQHGTAEVHVHTPTPNLLTCSRTPPAGWAGTLTPNKKGQNDNTEKQETQRPSVSAQILSFVPAVAVERVDRSNGHVEYSEYPLWLRLLRHFSPAHLLMYGDCFGTPA